MSGRGTAGERHECAPPLRGSGAGLEHGCVSRHPSPSSPPTAGPGPRQGGPLSRPCIPMPSGAGRACWAAPPPLPAAVRSCPSPEAGRQEVTPYPCLRPLWLCPSPPRLHGPSRWPGAGPARLFPAAPQVPGGCRQLQPWQNWSHQMVCRFGSCPESNPKVTSWARSSKVG